MPTTDPMISERLRFDTQAAAIPHWSEKSRPQPTLDQEEPRLQRDEDAQHSATEAFVELLRDTGCGELARVRVGVTPHSVRLMGAVSCFYHKQLAQEAIRGITDGRQVENQLRVS